MVNGLYLYSALLLLATAQSTLQHNMLMKVLIHPGQQSELLNLIPGCGIAFLCGACMFSSRLRGFPPDDHVSPVSKLI